MPTPGTPPAAPLEEARSPADAPSAGPAPSESGSEPRPGPGGTGRSGGIRPGWALTAAALVGTAPLLVTIVRLLVLRPPVWLYGDQALTDIAAANVYRGRMLLGPYSRFGWHHPGPAWFLFLGVFRALGGGSPLALLIGYLMGSAIAAVLVVVVTWRWLGPRAGWVMAALVAAFQWSFTFNRLAGLWNPYAVALPGLLLIVLCARIAVAERPWPATLGAVAVASFLVQTDVSTGFVVVALLAGAAATRVVVALRRRGRAGAAGADDRRPRPELRRRALRALELVIVLGVFWALPAYQQLTQTPGNGSRLASFFANGHGGHHGLASIRAVDTVWSSFPFRFDEAGQVQDANPVLLASHSIVTHPAFPLYLIAGSALLVLFVRRRAWMRAGLAGATVVALVAGAASAFLAKGPLYPYLVQWMQPFVIPVWLLAVDAGADWIGGRAQRAPAGPAGPRWAMAGAVVVSAAVVAGTLPHPPASITSVDFARQAWVAAGPSVTARSVHGVLVRPATPDDAPIAEAIADQAQRSGKAVSVPADYVYLFDPSFRDHGRADLEVIVCCSAAFPLHEAGTVIAGYVNGNVPILVRRLPHPAPAG